MSDLEVTFAAAALAQLTVLLPSAVASFADAVVRAAVSELLLRLLFA
jgi:hypothetical protein